MIPSRIDVDLTNHRCAILFPPLQHPEPATRVQFRLGAVLQHSTTPSLRVAGFEDEDDDEYENEAPCEGGSVWWADPGVETPG